MCAPPGYGKTLLLADWARRSTDLDTAWVSLDEDDNDRRRLWCSVLAAVATRPPDTQRLAGTASGADHEVLAEIVSHLGEQARPVRLILDRVDALVSPDAVDALAALISQLPARGRLVLSSRIRPPVPLPRPPPEGGLWELPGAELRFSLAETGRLFGSIGGRLTFAQVRSLHRLTDGWAAGLRLIARALRDVADPDRFLADFSGYDHPVADYLVAEVLSRLPEATRSFLTAVSIPDAFSPGLATALSGRGDAAELLPRLERETLLVSRAGSPGRLYRVQALTRSYLRAKLQRLDPVRFAELHAVAAAWWAARERPLPALEHAVLAGASSIAAGLLHRFGPKLLQTGLHPAVRRALDGIGTQATATDPLLAVLSAICHLEAGQVGAAADDLRRVDQSPATDDETALLRAVAGLFEAHATGRPLPSPAGPEPAPVVPAAAEPSVAALLRLMGRMGFEGDRDAARSTLEHGYRFAADERLDYLAMQCQTLLGALAAADGDYRSMSEVGGEVLELAATHGWQGSLWSSAARSMVANAALLRAEPATAERHASQGLHDGGKALTPAVRFALESCRGAALFDAGRQADGLLQMQQARLRLAAACVPAEQAVGAALMEHRAAVLLGDSAGSRAVLHWLRDRADAPGEALLMRAWSELSAGHQHTVGDLVHALLSGSYRLVLPHSRVEALLVLAGLELAAQHPAFAHSALQSALADAEPIDVLRPFAQASPSVRTLLLDQVGSSGAHGTFAARAVAALDRVAQPVSQPLVSERELAVLYLLPSLLSLEEIAENLSISTNTVKSHIRSIYAKLGASNRREAVVTAQEHGLLTTTLV